MKTHSWIIAALGSLATALALRYPLMEGWMARYVPGAPAANVAQATTGALSGAVLLLASAALTARLSGARSRAEAAGAGALAGLLGRRRGLEARQRERQPVAHTNYELRITNYELRITNFRNGLSGISHPKRARGTAPPPTA